MAYERSVGAVIYRVRIDGKRREPLFLLLRYPGGYWEFPRGHVEEGERELETARREIREETGLDQLQFRKGFRQRYRFHFKRSGRMVMKDAILYLAQARTWDVRVSEEHFGYVWVSYRDALVHLNFENSKIVMRNVRKFLEQERRPAQPPRASGAAVP